MLTDNYSLIRGQLVFGLAPHFKLAELENLRLIVVMAEQQTTTLAIAGVFVIKSSRVCMHTKYIVPA